MEIITSLKDFKKLSNSVITVGNYDGIHKGHRDVLSLARVKKETYRHA